MATWQLLITWIDKRRRNDGKPSALIPGGQRRWAIHSSLVDQSEDTKISPDVISLVDIGILVALITIALGVLSISYEVKRSNDIYLEENVPKMTEENAWRRANSDAGRLEHISAVRSGQRVSI